MLKTIQEACAACDNNKPTAQTQNTASTNNTNSTQTKAVSAVNKTISESSDLIQALEAVGAMYGIPSTHIIADDAAKSIRIVDDHIIAPALPNPKNYNKHIIQAIGGVLDYISQRIDDKLNEYQLNNAKVGRTTDRMKLADPNKGKCIGLYEDDEGGEIFAYDTGIVDAPNTPAAHAKIDELRANETIPTFDPSANRPSDIPGLSYFTDEDDITAGVDMDASANDAAGTVTTECNNVAKQIQESAYHVGLYTKYGDTIHLGYDLLRHQGFDFVKPIDSVVMESKTDEEEDKKEKKKIHATDIKHFKFDNSNITKAVEYFNKAREDQETNNKMDLNKFINNPNYEKAIKCLENQFNCHIALRFLTTEKGKYENCATAIEDELKKKLTISKSKGFQLGGLPINIYVYNHFMESNAPNDVKLFGQNMVSIILHEIFHNISFAMRMANANDTLSLAMTLELAASAKDVKTKRIIITNYVDTLGAVSKSNIIDKMAKKKMIKALTALSVVSNNSSAISNVKNASNGKKNPDKYIDDMIKKYKKTLNILKPHNTKLSIGSLLIGAGGIIAEALGVATYCSSPLGWGFGIAFFALLGFGIFSSADNAITNLAQKKYADNKNYEEFYSDLFAGMYNLPVFFFVGPSNKKYTPNEFNKEKLNQLAMLEKDVYKYAYATYPTDLERCHAAVTMSKEILKQNDIDKPVKDYCQWIIDNFSNVKNTDIATMHNETTFNPEEAEDLDKHLEELIKDNNVTLTESFVQWINSNDTVI